MVRLALVWFLDGKTLMKQENNYNQVCQRTYNEFGSKRVVTVMV